MSARKCVVCKKIFEPVKFWQKICSSEDCRAQGRHRNFKTWYRKNILRRKKYMIEYRAL